MSKGGKIEVNDIVAEHSGLRPSSTEVISFPMRR